MFLNFLRAARCVASPTSMPEADGLAQKRLRRRTQRASRAALLWAAMIFLPPDLSRRFEPPPAPSEESFLLSTSATVCVCNKRSAGASRDEANDEPIHLACFRRLNKRQSIH